jgi:hypothetical protein
MGIFIKLIGNKINRHRILKQFIMLIFNILKLSLTFGDNT